MDRFTIRSAWRPTPKPKPKIKTASSPKPGDYVEGNEIPPTRIFDQLSFIGDDFVGCHVLETTEGLILLDALWPVARSAEIIERGLYELGLDPHNIRAMLLTHAHGDHYGNGGYFMEKYGTVPYMSETDYKMAKCAETSVPFPPIPYEVTHFLSDGDCFTLGDTKIDVIATPGHSPGCLSFFFTVTDEGVPHTAAMMGGTSKPMLDRAAWPTHRDSTLYFAEECERRNVDVAIVSHPSNLNSGQRLAICRSISPALANPFVLGREACRRYERYMYDDVCAALAASDGK